MFLKNGREAVSRIASKIWSGGVTKKKYCNNLEGTRFWILLCELQSKEEFEKEKNSSRFKRKKIEMGPEPYHLIAKIYKLLPGVHKVMRAG